MGDLAGRSASDDRKRSRTEPSCADPVPGLAAPVMLGVLAGSLLGARLLVAIRVPVLRLVFAVVIAALGAEMIYSGATGRL